MPGHFQYGNRPIRKDPDGQVLASQDDAVAEACTAATQVITELLRDRPDRADARITIAADEGTPVAEVVLRAGDHRLDAAGRLRRLHSGPGGGREAGFGDAPTPKRFR